MLVRFITTGVTGAYLSHPDHLHLPQKPLPQILRHLLTSTSHQYHLIPSCPIRLWPLPIKSHLMAPLVPAHHPKDLQPLVQTRLNNKPHKPPFDLKKDCELKEMVQYFCDLDGPKENPRSKVVCEPCLRLFRV